MADAHARCIGCDVLYTWKRTKAKPVKAARCRQCGGQLLRTVAGALQSAGAWGNQIRRASGDPSFEPHRPRSKERDAAIRRARETFDRWLQDGSTWIGVFENKALDSAALGHRIAFAFGLDVIDAGVIGRTRAPDGAHGLGWKYLLVAKALTARDAIEAMYGPEGLALFDDFKVKEGS